jgi:hypothetical protein
MPANQSELRTELLPRASRGSPWLILLRRSCAAFPFLLFQGRSVRTHQVVEHFVETS